MARNAALHTTTTLLRSRKWNMNAFPIQEFVTRRTDISTGETYKIVVKLTLAKGASLKDPGLFNSSLDGNPRRAIDIREGETIDEDAFRALNRAAVSLNELSGRAPKRDGTSHRNIRLRSRIEYWEG
jgi:hypothetical protein